MEISERYAMALTWKNTFDHVVDRLSFEEG
jgi:hypothetical protein